MAQLRIIAVGPECIAADGRKYFGVDFSAGFGQRKVSRNFWQQFKRDAKTGLPTKELYWERGNRDMALELMAAGTPVEGQKITKTVEAYQIGENTVNQYSTVVFPDENIVNVFASANHNIVDEESGEILGKKRATLATRETIEAMPEVVSLATATK